MGSTQGSVQEADVVQESGLPELVMVQPMPGFPALRRFVLVRLDGGDPADPAAGDEEPMFFELRSLEEPAVRFLVGLPTLFFPDYAVELDDRTCGDLDLAHTGEALVLVVMSVGEDAADTTANLLAPIVVNARTRSAAQIILTGSDWPVRAAIG